MADSPRLTYLSDFIRFLVGVLVIHAIIATFHLVLMAHWTLASMLRAAYYHRGSGGKFTWVLFDYYLPTFALGMMTFITLRRQSILIHALGWLLCCITIAATVPIYSGRMVPQPVSAWAGAIPMPFDPIPGEKLPILLLVGFATIVGRLKQEKSSKNGATTEYKNIVD